MFRSLRDRRSKGKGKGIRARDRARGRREEGNLSFLPRAPKFPLPLPLPLPLLTPATQAMCSANNVLYQLTIFEFPIIHSVCPPNFA